MSKNPNKILDAWLVILLSLVFGASLAGVQATLGPRMQANKLDDTLGQIPLLAPGADKDKSEKVERGGQTVYLARNAEGAEVGWVLRASGQGFADLIELLIGLDSKAETITGLYILKQSETPGLGDFITRDEWRNQFKSKPASGSLVVVKREASSPEEIRAVTGATISSDAVTTTVNSAVRKFAAALAGAGTGGTP